MQIWKPCDKKRHHNGVITKSNGKTIGEMWTSAKSNKLYINQKVLMRAIQKCTAYWIWATMSKVVDIFVKFWHFLWCPLTKNGHITWPKKQILKCFYFVLTLHLYQESHKPSSGKALCYRSYQPQGCVCVWKTPPGTFRIKLFTWNTVTITGIQYKNTNHSNKRELEKNHMDWQVYCYKAKWVEEQIREMSADLIQN